MKENKVPPRYFFVKLRFPVDLPLLRFYRPAFPSGANPAIWRNARTPPSHSMQEPAPLPGEGAKAV